MSLIKQVLAFVALFFTVLLTTVQTGAAQNANYPPAVQNIVANLPTIKDQANSGNPQAQFFLGQAYYNGWGVPQDLVESVKWVRKAANQGLPLAQYALGYAYFHGWGVPQDLVVAVKWVRKAAEQGLAPAQGALGHAYYKGEGVPKDLVESVKWYRKAADQGFPLAQFSLGCAYYNGEGVPKDLVESVKWYRKAAEQGYPPAQLDLGRAYLNGIGVPQNVNVGIQWIRLAAIQGFQPAIQELNRLQPVIPQQPQFPGTVPMPGYSTGIPQPATEQTTQAPQPSTVPAVEKKPVSDNLDKIKKDEAAIRKCINDKYGVITPNPYGPKVDTFSKEIKNFKIVNNDGTNATVQFIVEEDTGFYLMNPGESGFPMGIYNRSKSQHQYTVHLKKVYGQWICDQELWNPILQDGGGMYPPDNNQYPSYIPDDYPPYITPNYPY